MIIYIYLLLGIAAGIAVPLCTGMADNVGDIWIMILAAIAFAVGLILLHILVVASGCLFIKMDKEPKSLKNCFRIAALSALDIFLPLIGANVKVGGAEKLPKEPFMLVCNHRSLIDAVAVVSVFRKYNVAFITKKENSKLPIVGKYMVKLGCLFLDREDTRAAVKTINKAADMIKSGMASVAICPEGTRNRTDELLLPFHAGSFKIAQKAKCPIVVVSVWGTDELKKHPVFKRTKIYVDVIDVIPTERVIDLRSGQLADMTKELIGKNLERYI